MRMGRRQKVILADCHLDTPNHASGDTHDRREKKDKGDVTHISPSAPARAR